MTISCWDRHRLKNIALNVKMHFNAKNKNPRCAPPCWWATGAARIGVGDRVSVSHKASLSVLSCFVFVFYSCTHSLFFLKCTLSFCSSREEWKSKSTQRRPHSDVFIGIVLTPLNSPSEKLMRRNGLVEEPTGCIHSCHHHLNPGLLSLQVWPPT